MKCFRFCRLDEEHDPSEEFEEYLACAVCGDNGKCPTFLSSFIYGLHRTHFVKTAYSVFHLVRFGKVEHQWRGN